MFDFNTMLDELYIQLDKNNKYNFVIPEPKFNKKPTRIDWINIKEFLKTVNRSYEHFLSFVKDERKMVASYNKRTLMIQGKFKPDDIIKVMKEYLNKYCKCPVCSKYNTYLVRDTELRKDKIICDTCKSNTYC